MLSLPSNNHGSLSVHMTISLKQASPQNVTLLKYFAEKYYAQKYSSKKYVAEKYSTMT